MGASRHSLGEPILWLLGNTEEERSLDPFPFPLGLQFQGSPGALPVFLRVSISLCHHWAAPVGFEWGGGGGHTSLGAHSALRPARGPAPAPPSSVLVGETASFDGCY